MSRTSSQVIVKSYVAWLVLIWSALALYFYGPYYKTFLSSDTKTTLFWGAVAYSLAAPAVYFLMWQRSYQLEPGRALLAFRTLRRLGGDYKIYLQKMITRAFYPAPEISRGERTNLLFIIVKLFFLPMMLNFLFSNIIAMHSSVTSLTNGGAAFNVQTFVNLAYPFLFSALLLIDTAYFTFGYAIESKYLGNKVVSVDPTFLGWFSALLCYPPLNSVTNSYLGWHANDYAVFHSIGATAMLYALVLAALFIYASASVALGPKASNLTNRGIVSRWPYSFIRHPAYISKNLAWWLTLLPVLSLPAIISMSIWSFIYFLRAITEERHLMMAGNGYKQYCQKVRWRFIPGVI